MGNCGFQVSDLRGCNAGRVACIFFSVLFDWEQLVRDVVIFGGGPTAELADFYLHSDTGLRVVAFTVEGQYVEQDVPNGLVISPFGTEISLVPSSHIRKS